MSRPLKLLLAVIRPLIQQQGLVFLTVSLYELLEIKEWGRLNLLLPQNLS